MATRRILPRTDDPAHGAAPGLLRRHWLRWALWALAILLLGAVFLAYLSPHLAVDLATRVWSCF